MDTQNKLQNLQIKELRLKQKARTALKYSDYEYFMELAHIVHEQIKKLKAQTA